MRRKHFRRVLALVTALTVAIGLTVPAAYAASDFNSYNTGTIEVNIGDKVPVKEKITVNLYKVATAEVGKNGYIKYTKTAPFDPGYGPEIPDVDPNVDSKNYKENEYGVGNVSLDSTTDDTWIARAKTLAGYTKKDGFNDRAKETKNYWTDTAEANDSVKFGFGEEKLEKGLYLITVDPVTSGGKTYTFSPVLRCLPSLDNNNEWNPNQKINYPSSKIEETSNGGGGGGNSTKSITVLKIWKDEGQKSDRPDSVTVELLRDGEVYASQELSESNNWKHTWTGLKGNSWVVNEVGAPSDKYTVLTEAEGNTFTVTNTHTTDIDEPDTPLDPGPGGDPGTGGDIPPTNIDDPDVPLDPGRTPGDNATNIKDPASPANAAKLPQTGQLWWPVPILAVAGIAFFSIGWLRSRKDESEENK